MCLYIEVMHGALAVVLSTNYRTECAIEAKDSTTRNLEDKWKGKDWELQLSLNCPFLEWAEIVAAALKSTTDL